MKRPGSIRWGFDLTGKMGERARHLRRYLLIGLATGMIGVVASFSKFLLQYELKTLDWRLKLRGFLTPHPDIVIVAIDERSIALLGRWPWRRSLHARLIRRLKEAGAKVVALDIFFTEPSTKEEDEALAEAMREAGNVFVALFSAEKGGGRVKKGLLEKFSICPAPPRRYWERPLFKPPISEVSEAVRGAGFVDTVSDFDAIYRRMFLLGRSVADGRLYPSLPLAVVSYLMGTSPKRVEVLPNGGVKVGEVEIPPTGRKPGIVERGMFFVNHPGPAWIYPHYSYVDVLEGRVPPEKFRGKIVLVGATAPGLYDIRPSPFDGMRAPERIKKRIPFEVAEGLVCGIHINAAAIDTILQRRFIKDLSRASLPLVLLFALLMAFFVHRLRPWLCALAFFALAGGYLLFSVLLLKMAFSYVLLFPVLSSTAASLAFSAIYRASVEEREKGFIRSHFALYVPPAVVDEILQDPSKLVLGGVRREITVMFSDIRGFTSMSERMEPEEVVSMLNEYFTAMTEVIFKYEGTLDKFIGDAIMAIFGAPTDQPDHAERAVLCALEMQRALKGLSDLWKRSGRPSFRVGIGIHTGEAVVGNVGSRMRLQYTAIGDNVNLAQRVEELTKEFGVDTLITEATYQRVKDLVEVRDLGEVKVRGREEPVRVFEVLGIKGTGVAKPWENKAPSRRG